MVCDGQAAVVREGHVADRRVVVSMAWANREGNIKVVCLVFLKTILKVTDIVGMGWLGVAG